MQTADEIRQTREDGERILRADYWEDVRDTAESIKAELADRIKDGERGEPLREWPLDHIHETVDGSRRVFITGLAIECLLFSDNDGAYIEEFGTDGVVSDGSINWSALAYAAFERDVIAQLEALDVDVNDPDPYEEEDEGEEEA